MEINELLDWIPVFVILGITVTGIIFYKKVTVKAKIEQVKEIKKEQKKKESFGGAINEMIDTAPNNLKQIESEIQTLETKADQMKVSPEQKKEMLARLYQERDMLKIAVKYGHLAKPLTGSVGKLLEKVLNGIGQ